MVSRVVVVGGANWDRTWLLPSLPLPGETQIGEPGPGGPGGKALNIAVGLVRLNAEAALVARVGRDVEGDALLAALRDEGVELSGIERVDSPTGAAAILVAGGESTIAVAPGANAALDGDAVTRSLALCGDGCELIVLQAEAGDSALLAAAGWAIKRRSGVAAIPPGRQAPPLVVLSPAPARTLPDEVWRAADAVICNRREAAVHTGLTVEDPLDAEEAAIALCRRGPATAVVTLGADGAVVARGGRATYLPPFTVDAVDPTGAGDSAAAAFSRAVLEGFDIFAATGYAMAAAALSVTRPGAASSMPTADEVDRIVHSVDLRRDPGTMPVEFHF